MNTRDSSITFLKDIWQRQSAFVETARNAGNFEGLTNLLSQLYPDKAHFIYELLQNAEDAGARNCHFDLTENTLTFTHDGKRLFTQEDVTSITRIGNSSKKNDDTQIGKFGIGFKAVFAYTTTPQIHSGDFDFEIHDHFCPMPIPEITKASEETKFIFIFNNPSKPAQTCYNEIEQTLRTLPLITLLFLNNIEYLSWQCNSTNIGFTKRSIESKDVPNIVTITHKADQEQQETEERFLLFTSGIKAEVGQQEKSFSIAVAYSLTIKDSSAEVSSSKAKSGLLKRLVPVDGQVSVFFPALKETSKLLFHLHAPFAATVARDGIFHEHPGNVILRDKLGRLIADSLIAIRDQGLLTPDFLTILPLEQDRLSPFYEPIRQLINEALKTQSLLPTNDGGFAPALNQRQPPKKFKDVMGREERVFFLDYSDLHWAINIDQPNSRQEQLLNNLEVTRWGWNELILALNEKFNEQLFSKKSESSRNSIMWIRERSTEWLKKFYGLLNELPRSSKPEQWRIVRTHTGGTLKGSKLHFPIGQDTALPEGVICVDPAILVGDKLEIDPVRSFLSKAGVKEFDAKAKVELLLHIHYRKINHHSLTTDDHLNHLKEITDWFLQHVNNYGHTGINFMFRDYVFLRDKEGVYRKPSETYIDSPLYETGLSAAFVNQELYPLAPIYRKIIGFIPLARSIGVTFELKVEPSPARRNPDQHKLFWELDMNRARVTDYKEENDYTIKNLGVYLKRIVDNEDTDMARLLWNTMCKQEKYVLEASYTPNASSKRRTASSFLVHELRKCAWIPDKFGHFRNPQNLEIEDLRPDFLPSNRNGWLEAIGFGEEAKRVSNERTEKRKKLKELGFSDYEDSLELLELLNTLDSDDRQQIKREIANRKQNSTQQRQTRNSNISYAKAFTQAFSKLETKVTNDNFRFSTEDVTSPVPAKRRENLQKQAQADRENEPLPIKRFSIVPRRVLEAKNSQTRQSLEAWYQGRCQIDGYSFKKRDGTLYFEGIYIVPFYNARWLDNPGNVLCLCPNCSVQFQYGTVEFKDDILQQIDNYTFDKPLEEKPSLNIILCGEFVALGFHPKHLAQLQALLKADS